MFGSDVRERTEQFHGQFADLCAAMEPDTVPLTDSAAVFDHLVAIQKLAEGAVVRMTARYEQAGEWKRNGSKSLEDDLARKTGSSKGRAKKTAKTSRRLKKQSKTDEAVRNGKLSPEQADLVSSGAEASPADEDALLDSAGRDPLHELRDKAARGDKDPNATRARQHRLRSYREWIDEEGMSNHHLRLPPDKGAEVRARLVRDIDRAFADARDAGRFESREAYAADAVYDILSGRRTSRYREHPTTTNPTAAGDTEAGSRGTTSRERNASGGEYRDNADSSDGPGAHDADLQGPDDPLDRPGQDVSGRSPTDHEHPTRRSRAGPTRPDPERLPRRRVGNQAVRPECKVIVHIDAAALNRGYTVGDELCEIAGVGPVSVTVARSVVSDAFLALVIRDGVDIRNVTHLGRQVTAHQRTALEARGYQCEVEGCASTYRLDIDHNLGWTLTHDTCIEDLSYLCGADHDRKTREDLILIGPTGHKRLVPRDHPDAPPHARVERAGSPKATTAQTATPGL